MSGVKSMRQKILTVTIHDCEVQTSGTTLRQAIAEWEDITDQRASALGCSCCGVPHSFSFQGTDGSYDYYAPSYPAYGDDY